MPAFLRWSDERVEQWMGLLLRTGVVSAAGVVLVGAVLFLAGHGSAIADYHVFHGEPAALCNLREIVAGARAVHGQALIQLGVLMLIATPIARVALSLVVFALRRDGLYTAVTLIVLAVLAFSLLAHPA
jgi:uncharacterized membrane protein